MDQPVLYRVNSWDARFESAKSRTYKMKSQSYMPNKVGIGYMRIMREHDGAAVYGAWCALIALLSRMEGPRQGYLTDTGKDTGRVLDADTIGMLTMIHPDIVSRMLKLCSSKDVGWLDVMHRRDTARDTAKDTAGILPGIADGPSPLPLPLPLPRKSVSPTHNLKLSEAGPGRVENGDKYGQIRTIPQAELAQWAVNFCGDDIQWVRVYKSYIRDIGPEAFRAILEQFAAECAAGEEPRVRGKAFCKRVKAAVDDKKAVAK